jgi:hypothetical protein
MHLTEELLGLAQAKLKNAELALDANATYRWPKVSVEFLRDEVEKIRRLQVKCDKQGPS